MLGVRSRRGSVRELRALPIAAPGQNTTAREAGPVSLRVPGANGKAEVSILRGVRQGLPRAAERCGVV